ncbi:Electron transport complex protein RnfB [Paramagnetospirillum magnetotacticum MS-1]|uniref:Electron transport complex protein RnfB n=1 Tax=Paramagnetospirillum magnetotacticum MS-1 TaxID=272627 RepID=A0A0C2V1T7_PARME|nr:RnfABCDGE type electron transport complex subunit B [Paramagnetospirillum magnetotacticum]KIL99051.1 Electron transport complex protein RnfB [Paramagnetospirillum magnetotacticum MS-1]
MLLDVGSLAVMGVTLGAVLGTAAKLLAVPNNPIEEELQNLLPGSQCGQCGFVGCAQYAAALAKGGTPVTLCAPGGKATIEALAKKLGVHADADGHEEVGPRVAFVNEDLCIGCLRCIGECGSDAIVGAPKQLHTVIADACHACGKCFKICPTEAIEMRPIPQTIAAWHWNKPGEHSAH